MYNGALVCTTAIKRTAVQWISMYNGVYDDVTYLWRFRNCKLRWRRHNSDWLRWHRPGTFFYWPPCLQPLARRKRAFTQACR